MFCLTLLVLLLSLLSVLHAAAIDGNPEAITRLLPLIDPSQKDRRGRVAYFLCANGSCRDAFRKFCAHNVDMWNWDHAKVEPLTDEMEDRKKEKLKEKRKKQKEKQKEKKQLEREEEVLQAEKRLEEERKLKEELKGLPCANCQKGSGKKPFYCLNYSYCSTDCVQSHKRKLAANAALARFNP